MFKMNHGLTLIHTFWDEESLETLNIIFIVGRDASEPT